MKSANSKPESQLKSSFDDAERGYPFSLEPPPFDPIEDIRTIFREWRKIVAADKADKAAKAAKAEKLKL